LSAVCNSTPLIHLGRIGQLELLHLVLGRVLVPPAVIEEVRPYLGDMLETALHDGWLVSKPPTNAATVIDLEQRLGGRGEAEVIALALEQADQVVLVDESAARQVCEAKGLAVRGTLGVLLDAKERGLLRAIRPLIDALRSTGFWLDESLSRRVLELAGED
jgi:predicted nucleic acid-binding protein